jgi:hypothetical protein
MTSEDFRNDDDKAAAEAGKAADEQVKGRDGGPFDADDAAAAEGLTSTPEQASHYEEMVEKGAHQKGEGDPEG